MKPMMFPRMLFSHDEGWAWLMETHPSVPKIYFLYVVPMSLIPPAMLLYAAHNYGDRMLGNISLSEAWWLAGLFFVAELVLVPAMGAVIQRIGDVANARPAYHDAFAFAAVVPTPLWLSALALFIPSLTINALATVAALFGAAALIYEGTYRLFRLKEEGSLPLLSGSILAAGLVAWASLMGLAFVGWGWIIS